MTIFCMTSLYHFETEMSFIRIGFFHFGVVCSVYTKPCGFHFGAVFKSFKVMMTIFLPQPPGDVFQITRQQLVDELRAVMSSTVRFSQYCVPLLIEKISSDLQSAKQDSFATLVGKISLSGTKQLLLADFRYINSIYLLRVAKCAVFYKHIQRVAITWFCLQKMLSDFSMIQLTIL